MMCPKTTTITIFWFEARIYASTGTAREMAGFLLFVVYFGTSAATSARRSSAFLGHIAAPYKTNLGSLVRASSIRKKIITSARGGTQESDVESAELPDEQNDTSTYNQSNTESENGCLGGRSSETLTQKAAPFTIWQALFQPELLSQASAEREKAEIGGGICSRSPPPEAMDVFLFPLAFLPGRFLLISIGHILSRYVRISCFRDAKKSCSI
jgi:hypothetical protein